MWDLVGLVVCYDNHVAVDAVDVMQTHPSQPRAPDGASVLPGWVLIRGNQGQAAVEGAALPDGRIQELLARHLGDANVREDACLDLSLAVDTIAVVGDCDDGAVTSTRCSPQRPVVRARTSTIRPGGARHVAFRLPGNVSRCYATAK